MSFIRDAVLSYSVWNRRRKAAQIALVMKRLDVQTLLLCGAMARAKAGRNEGIVERLAAAEADYVVGFNLAPQPEQPWPFVVADARDLPFRDKSWDFVVSNAVIEHVGGLEEQQKFVAEHCRVSRAWVITTPNRWFPVESHTSSVFRHWRPRWREERREFTRLMSRREFRSLLPADAVVAGRPWSATFTAWWADNEPGKMTP